jgi:hypothetical protein
MKLIDRIAINRAIQAFIDLIINIAEAFSGKKIEKPEPPTIIPLPKPVKPLKRVVDKIIPWRKENE